MGASMDPELLRKGVMAHHKAIGAASESNPVLSKADFEAINAAIGRMIASVPESQTMAVYDSFSALVPAEVPQYLMSTVNEGDAKRAYSALMAFKDVVKANPITPQVKETPAALSAKLGAIDGAAAKLSVASYPFLQSAPWDSDVYLKPLPGVSPYQAVKAALGKVIASVPSSQVMDVFNAFSKITGP